MDTDDLTPMAYETISLAGDVLDVLRTEIGASAAGKKTEDEFLRSAREYLDSWNYLDTINVRNFRAGVKSLLEHVEKTLATSLAERGKWEN